MNIIWKCVSHRQIHSKQSKTWINHRQNDSKKETKRKDWFITVKNAEFSHSQWSFIAWFSITKVNQYNSILLFKKSFMAEGFSIDDWNLFFENNLRICCNHIFTNTMEPKTRWNSQIFRKATEKLWRENRKIYDSVRALLSIYRIETIKDYFVNDRVRFTIIKKTEYWFNIPNG